MVMIPALFLHWNQACTWFQTSVFSGKWHGDYSFSLFSVCIKLLEICFHLSLQWSICYSQKNFCLFPCTSLRSASAWHFAKLFYFYFLFIFFCCCGTCLLGELEASVWAETIWGTCTDLLPFRSIVTTAVPISCEAEMGSPIQGLPRNFHLSWPC